jgi:hypothetical protein
MYNKTEICSCQISASENKKYTYRYFLLEGAVNVEIEGEFIKIPSYGIEIISEEIIDNKIASIDGELIDCVDSIKNRVLDLIELLKINSVSPVHLIDVVGIYADYSVADFDSEARNIFKASILA